MDIFFAPKDLYEEGDAPLWFCDEFLKDFSLAGRDFTLTYRVIPEDERAFRGPSSRIYCRDFQTGQQWLSIAAFWGGRGSLSPAREDRGEFYENASSLLEALGMTEARLVRRESDCGQYVIFRAVERPERPQFI